MKIFIDCRPVEESRGGTSFYIKHLIQALSRIDSPHLYYLLIKEERVKKFFDSLPSNFEFLSFPYRFLNKNFLFIIYHFLLSYWIKKQHKVDICFFPYSQSPLFFFSPFVVTVHDLAIFKYPQWFTRNQGWAKYIITPLSLKRAQRILAVSQTTKRDLIQFMPSIAEKIRVVYEGVISPPLSLKKSSQKISAVLRKFKIKSQFILFIGTLEPRKNLVRLLEAFYKLQRHKNNLQLVIVGEKGWKYKAIFQTYQRLNLQHKVVFTGFVSEEEKWILLLRCKIFVYPSLYEGFGLPVLEAQRAGIPVICGKYGSLPEITQGSAFLINPYSVEEIYQAMRRLLKNKQLAQRLVKKGLKNVKRFSWQKSAQQTLKIFKEVLRI